MNQEIVLKVSHKDQVSTTGLVMEAAQFSRPGRF